MYDHISSYTPTDIPILKTKTYNLDIGICKQCYSLQFIDLIPPHILYKDSHNETFNTPTWSRHHNSFFNFCKENIHMKDKKIIIEIGGGQCILAKKFLDSFPDINYTILDFIRNPNLEPKFNFIQQDCETYAFSEDIVIMSHVFEHLHNPRLFLNTLKNSRTTKLIISVPNLEYLLGHQNINLIHIEHTFYFNEDHLKTLMSEFGFEIGCKGVFENHSNFYSFEKTDCAFTRIEQPISLYSVLENYYTHIYNTIMTSLAKIKNIDNVWIMPAGHYGYNIYTNCIRAGIKNKVVGFLDNDKSKQNKFMTGTDISIQSPSIIKEKKNVNIILYGGIYTEEICSSLKVINKDANLIILYSGIKN